MANEGDAWQTREADPLLSLIYYAFYLLFFSQRHSLPRECENTCSILIFQARVLVRKANRTELILNGVQTAAFEQFLSRENERFYRDSRIDLLRTVVIIFV